MQRFEVKRPPAIPPARDKISAEGIPTRSTMQAPVDFNALFNTLAVDAPFAVHYHGAFYYDKYAAGLLQEHPFKGGPENMPERQSAALSLSTEEAATVAGDSFDIRTEFPHCKSTLTIFDQGSCGGCWALSTAGTLSDRFCAKGSDVVLSPQDLLDCVTDNSKGCSGGFTEDGFDYIADEVSLAMLPCCHAAMLPCCHAAMLAPPSPLLSPTPFPANFNEHV